MKGMPKHLNTKQDYANIRELFSESEWKPRHQELLDTRFIWSTTGELAEGETGVTDDTHRVLTEEWEGKTTRIQQEYIEDPNAKLSRLGFTVAELEALLG